MTRSIKFFYFGNQCPHNGYLLARIKTIAWKEGVRLELFDISEDWLACEKYRVFSPQMLLVNDRYRLHGPFTKERVRQLLEDEDVDSSPSDIEQGDRIVRGDLVPITPESVLSTCEPCTNTQDKGLCRGKAEWTAAMLETHHLDHIGYMHFQDGSCIGGAEFLPSMAVPYPILDKEEGDAFLTCVHQSHETYDYKTHPLEHLVADLKNRGFKRISVAAAKKGTFPNGPLSWFEGKGFADKGLLVMEELHDSEIHYLQLDIGER
ncbi:MAG: hypothetical protein KKE24_02535 [Candidatus Thermoplasmatota archaeon]|nr:hypothetical protein [Candidatus Thermoplasmatota archaeon]